VVQFLNSLPIRESSYPRIELEPVRKWVDLRIGYERDCGLGTMSDQLEWFNFFLQIARSHQYGGTQSYGRCLLSTWAFNSANIYAIPYSSGYQDGNINGSFYATKRAKLKAKKTAMQRVRKATNGRRLIGETTRAKVLKEAEKLRHKMTKESAAYAIAEIVKKDSGTVKRYLTELFPGEKWKTTNQ